MKQSTLYNNTHTPAVTKPGNPCTRNANPRTRVRHFVGANWKGSEEKLRYLFGATNEMSESLTPFSHEGIVCYHKINHARHLNRFLATVNRSLVDGGTFIGCVETEKQLKRRIRRDYSAPMQWIFRMVHYIVTFFRPVSKISKKWYALTIRDVNRVLPIDEVFDRLHSNGFAIFDFEEISGQTYFAVRKIKDIAGMPAHAAQFASHRSSHSSHAFGDAMQEHTYFSGTICMESPVRCRKQLQWRPFQNN
ncbi:hypothetical protein [Natronogracilivirga saccharolytica]|uniref:Uncharacterized protein n=1 Tax=Natronogracilivirga saccharolytica TaxID=2812953 RepID=A0A8J7RVR9_9BACT|nr:hypothetical protein [Natronogracilivirga saccharolytica]MBP3193842.1 hypothetical protein [Natronogracilivirga saccharolytica]